MLYLQAPLRQPDILFLFQLGAVNATMLLRRYLREGSIVEFTRRNNGVSYLEPFCLEAPSSHSASNYVWNAS